MANSYPDSFRSENYLRMQREDAERRGETNREIVLFSLMYYFSTGRAMVGLPRLLAHMEPRTIDAFVRRVQKGMEKHAKECRDSKTLVTGDLNNTVLAAALGYNTLDDAATAIVHHPYGEKFTFVKKVS